MSENSFVSNTRGLLCLPFVAVVNALTVLYTLSVFLLADSGISVRPMGWAAMIFMIEFANLLAGIFLLLQDIAQRKIRALYIAVSVVLILSPLPIAMGLFYLLVQVKGLHILA